MKSLRLLALLAVPALALTIFSGGAGRAAGTTLYANVGPGYVISLTDAAGAPVTQLPAGTYTIVVTDQASNHNFHLMGPGVNMMTTEAFIGQVTWTVTLSAGSYQYVCDPHADGMFGGFTVTGGDTTPPETTITAGPSGTVSSSSASFSFASSEAGSSFECALDGAAFAACSSPKSYSGLAAGGHSFQVRAIDAAGNADPTPASRSWTIATAPTPTDSIEVEGRISALSDSSITVEDDGRSTTCSIPSGTRPSGYEVGDEVEMECDLIAGSLVLTELERED